METVASGPSIRQVIKQLPHVLKAFRKESNALVSEYQSRGHLSEQKRKRYEDLSRRMQLIESVQSLLRSKDKASLMSVFGPKLQYLPLLLDCFHSSPFGIHFSSLSRRRAADEGRLGDLLQQAVQCRVLSLRLPDANQQPNGHLAEAERLVGMELVGNASVRLGGSREEAASIQLKNDRSWEHTLIGSRNRWLQDMEVPDHWKAFERRGDFRTQVYEGEDVCIDGSRRHTAVLYECGEEGIGEFHVRVVGEVENRNMECATTR